MCEFVCYKDIERSGRIQRGRDNSGTLKVEEQRERKLQLKRIAQMCVSQTMIRDRGGIGGGKQVQESAHCVLSSSSLNRTFLCYNFNAKKEKREIGGGDKKLI